MVGGKRAALKPANNSAALNEPSERQANDRERGQHLDERVTAILTHRRPLARKGERYSADSGGRSKPRSARPIARKAEGRDPRSMLRATQSSATSRNQRP